MNDLKDLVEPEARAVKQAWGGFFRGFMAGTAVGWIAAGLFAWLLFGRC